MIYGFMSSMMMGGGQAVIPVLVDSVSNSTSGNSTTSATLPAYVAGDLLVVIAIINSDQARTLSTTPSGWAALILNSAGVGNQRRMAVFYKTATGTEGASLTITSNGTGSWTTLAMSFRGATAAPEASTGTTGTSTAPDPASLSPSWGSARVLWMAVTANYTNQTSITAPSAYSGLITVAGTSGAYPGRISVAFRDLVASSEDPGSFTLSGSAGWQAYTVALK